MLCEERIRLLEICASTMNDYIRESVIWQGLTDGLNSAAYRVARMDREAARIQVDLAKYQLERHEELHQCYPNQAEPFPY
jgi:hypothetical protein